MRALWLLVAALLGCAAPSDPLSYRLPPSGSHWSQGEDDPLLRELDARYPQLFAVVLDPGDTREPDLRPLRRDLEREPVDRRNYDALNALAIAYFELNYRAEADRGGAHYLGDSFRASHLLAVPWRAYGEIRDPHLRDAILDFFEDAASGEKLGTAGTAPRVARVVASLERKEPDAARRARILRLAASSDPDPPSP
jgi:hypothetical protein